MTSKPFYSMRASPRRWRAAVLVAAGLAASPALAEVRPATPRPLAVGGPPISSEIDTGDAQVNGQYTEEYVLQLSGGAHVRIDMEATGAEGTRRFDTYLRLFDSAGTEVSFNDDRGDGTLNSRLIVAATADATYRIRAQGFSDRTGTYRISASVLPPAQPPQAIAAGEHPLVLDAQSSVGERIGAATSYRDFEFDGVAGDRVYLRATPAEAQAAQASTEGALANIAAVHLTLSEGGNEVANADGLPGYDDPRIFVILPRGGRYRLRASVPLGSEARLTLRFDRRAAGGAPTLVRTVPRNATVMSGQLSLDSNAYAAPENPDQILSLSEIYALQVRPDEQVVVTLSSSDFDPILDAGTFSVIGYATAESNNDGDAAFNSRLTLRPSRGGVVHLRVRSTSPALGGYELRIERAPRTTAPPAPAPAAQ